MVKKTFELSDGSTVTLNSASKLELSADFNQELRVVRLAGEGYFQVAKNKENLLWYKHLILISRSWEQHLM
jgi:ferric-dicitrate binding protein FerR (iron transport regulator)